MRPSRYLPALAVALVLALTGSAQAETPSFTSDGIPATERVQPYLDRASAFWADRGGYVNCPAGVHAWWATITDYTAAADIGGCNIWIDSERWHQERSPRRRCLIVVHEYGHLIGLADTDNPNNIMSPEVPWHPTRRCRFG